jgi:hypothetical protein
LTDSIYFKNTYFYKEREVLKITNIISVPHLNNEASIYYHKSKPFKSFWAFTKDPYLQVFPFYYFKGKNINDDIWEDFKTYSPYEYERAINLVNDFKTKFNR